MEEIITPLSRFQQLFVIARNSSFTYKGRAVDVKQVGRELGVRYILEGSVRRLPESISHARENVREILRYVHPVLHGAFFGVLDWENHSVEEYVYVYPDFGQQP